MRRESRTAEQQIARMATRAHGVVTRRQLLDAGVSAAAIDRRVRNALLIAAYPGVYFVGHRANHLHARYLAAVLACGPAAWLRGEAAGCLFGIIKGPVPPPEVGAPTERRVRGVRTTRVRRPDRRDLMTFDGIPVTTIPRTLVDLAAVLTAEELARVWHEAMVRYRAKPHHVEATLARHPNAKGARDLRRVLHGDERVTLSELERIFLRLLTQAALPLPETNRRVGSYYVDCRWPRHRLTVELISYRYHSSRYAWEHDNRRAREARKRGDEFCRYTYGDVTETPQQVVAELRPLLA